MPVKQTVLSRLAEFNPDSTYAVCIFSYDCPSCWDYIENLKQYENAANIDRVIAFSVGEVGNEFTEFFKSKF